LICKEADAVADKLKSGFLMPALAVLAAAMILGQIYACDSAVESGDGGATDGGGVQADGGGSKDGGGAKTCDDYKAACIMALDNGCFNPSGGCVISNLTEAKWDNGAKIDISVSTDLTTYTIKWYSSNAKLCYTALYIKDAPFIITDANGKVYTATTDKTDNSVTVTCPNGTQEKYAQAEYDAISACFGGEWENTFKDCKVDTNFCKSDLDCLLSPLGQKCCVKSGYSYCWKSC
jgi:hypothetical protein